MVIILERDLSIKHSVNGRFLGVTVLITKSSKSPEEKKKNHTVCDFGYFSVLRLTSNIILLHKKVLHL